MKNNSIHRKMNLGDMGIDGRIFPVGTKPAEAASKGKKNQTDHMFAEDWYPIQVKQMDKVGRPDIDGFEAVMMREGILNGTALDYFSQRPPCTGSRPGRLSAGPLPRRVPPCPDGDGVTASLAG